MRAIVTGAAGFIGSHLCEHLLAAGDDVLGIDAMTDYYPVARKKANLARLLGRDDFAFRRGDLLALPLEREFADAEALYHLAGQPGVRASWGPEFAVYLERNVRATQRVLEAAHETRLPRMIFASSSSVYGDAETCPTAETERPRPVSPYGVSKLAAEHLCEIYRDSFAVPVTSLRLFTVYGPRQRPDMAFSRLITAALTDGTFPLHGDGGQTRDFTYVADVVNAMRKAALSPWHGVANIGGGRPVTMHQILAVVAELIGPVRVDRHPAQPGDARHTAADITTAREAFGYRPATGVREGLAAMVAAERAAWAVTHS
ncbi:NAD-dependent epimerase/dehydratase family protein [Streptomyces sp. NPDC050145]|uniref:NAD-dependent epimerase/dehydratase family protein n=1 Tax=Streptomyces sp. NPDC050145 TaxID=3365602 RepID=UPI0037AAC816